jgi:hypothetical protein
MCNLTVAKTDNFGSIVDSKRKCVQKTSVMPSRAVSGHGGCMHEYHLFFLGGGDSGNIGRFGVEKASWVDRWKKTCTSECNATLY